ncbi:MAG TPA: hypothetical protein VFR67_08325, partial [Pilimelia sp.]|nr:hypothetical protein [Pilimelia sp.]
GSATRQASSCAASASYATEAARRRCGDVKGLPGRAAGGLGPHGYLDQGPATNGSTSHEPTDR